MAKAAKKTKLTSLSEIYAYFRQNQTPITFLSPTPYNILGLGRWINKFEYINFFDSFDGTHPKIVVPREHGPHEFRSIEDVNNYLLRHKEVRARLKERGPGLLLLVMFDEETEFLAGELGLKIALPPAKLRKHIDSKITTTQLGNEAGIQSAPNILGKAKTYEELLRPRRRGEAGPRPRRPDALRRFRPHHLLHQVRGRLVHPRGRPRRRKTSRSCAASTICPAPSRRWRRATAPWWGRCRPTSPALPKSPPTRAAGAAMTCSPAASRQERKAVTEMAQKLGDQLYKAGYKGAFCMDFLIDTDTREVYLGEINPRISGASPMTNLITSTYGGCPIYMFHLLEFMDVDWELDLAKVQERWSEFDNWSQLILKYPVDRVEMITKAPSSGIYRMDANGAIKLVRKSIDWFVVSDEDEAFYLRVYTAGDYRYHGADLGILVSRGRFQTDDRQLTDRAKAWVKAINGEFESIAVTGSSAPAPPPDACREQDVLANYFTKLRRTGKVLHIGGRSLIDTAWRGQRAEAVEVAGVETLFINREIGGPVAESLAHLAKPANAALA